MRWLLAVLVLSACNGERTVSVDAPSAERSVARGPMGVIVTLRSAKASDVARAHGITPRFIYSHALNGFAANLSDGAISGLSRNPHVQSIEPDGIIGLAGVQSGASWNLDRIDQRTVALDGLYHYDRTGAGVHAYIIDTGIRASHSDFTGRASGGADFTGLGSTDDCNGHGTHVAALVGGAIWGVAKDILLHPLRVFGCQGDTPESVVIAAIDWVTANAERPAVVNMSLSGLASENPSLSQAVENSIATGVTYTIAAGNNGLDACSHSPGNAPSALTVGSSMITAGVDRRDPTTNFGNCIDLFSPGFNIISAGILSDTATQYMSGTSMASPHVAGVAALFLEGNPLASPLAVADAIKGGVTHSVVTLSQSSNCNLLFSGSSTTEPRRARKCPK